MYKLSAFKCDNDSVNLNELIQGTSGPLHMWHLLRQLNFPSQIQNRDQKFVRIVTDIDKEMNYESLLHFQYETVQVKTGMYSPATVRHSRYNGQNEAMVMLNVSAKA